MNNAANICFKSACGRYGVSFRWSMFRRMLHECVKAGNKETGGIVWGKYNDKLDEAIVSGFSKAPIDSKAGWCSFVRGVAGLQQTLQSLWSRANKKYYLGEWHFHPFASSAASQVDVRQMLAHATDSRLQCPEPILMIIGGDPSCNWSVDISVYTRKGEIYNLVPNNDNWRCNSHQEGTTAPCDAVECCKMTMLKKDRTFLLRSCELRRTK